MENNDYLKLVDYINIYDIQYAQNFRLFLELHLKIYL